MESKSVARVGALVAMAAVLAGCAGLGKDVRPATISTFCDAYERSDKRQSLDIRIEFAANGDPTALILAGNRMARDGNERAPVTACRGEKIRWVGKDRNFEIQFKSPDDSPFSIAATKKSKRVANSDFHEVQGRLVRDDALGVQQERAAHSGTREFKYTICVPACAEAEAKLWDPVIIVEK